MVNHDGEPSKDMVKVSTKPADAELALEYQKQLHATVLAMMGNQGVGIGPTLPILRNEISYVESLLNNSITVENMMPQWLANVASNYRKHFSDRINPFDFTTRRIKKSAIVVGAGPSISQPGMGFPYIEEYTGTIVCTNKSLKSILYCETEPDFVVAIHGTEDIKKDFEHTRVTRYMEDEESNTKYILASSLHPDVSDFICEHVPEKNIIWFNASINETLVPSYNVVLASLTGLPCIDTGGNVGIFATLFAKLAGAEVIGLFGLEHCHQLDPHWSNEVAQAMEITYAPQDGLLFAMSPVFRSYFKQFYQFISQCPDTKFINLVKNGRFYVDREILGVPYMHLKEFVGTYD